MNLNITCCLVLILPWSSSAIVNAGWEPPSYIDGCQSIDGRYVITAERTSFERDPIHGPLKWDFIWKDTETGATRRFHADGIQDGQIYAQLFIAPDGKTFALWNGIQLYSRGGSHQHGPPDLHYKEDSPKWREREEFTHRLMIYNAQDGALIKHLGVGDLIHEAEWQYVTRQFNRVHFMTPIDGRDHKRTPRKHYAWYRVSPDYTVLQVNVGNPRSTRSVSISLTDGRVFPSGHEFKDPVKNPVKPFRNADSVPCFGPAWLEAYTPSLDPVRLAGTYAVQSAEEAFPARKGGKPRDFTTGKVELIAQGFKKADTPAWLRKTGKKPEQAGRLIFTDLDAGLLYHIPPGETDPVVLRAGATRGRLAYDTFVGLVDNRIARWKVNSTDEPQVLVESGPEGREVSLNDLVVSSRGLIYFTTLKDPEKGRLSVLDPETKKVTVLFDGEDEPTLANPNGISLSRHERFLYVGISNYRNRKHSGVYAFPIREDGTIDVEVGKVTPRFPVKAPDGITVDRQGNVYFTSGNTVHVFTPHAEPLAKIRIPKGSGTNLCFGGDQAPQRNLFVTTWNAVYSVQTPVGK